MTETEIQFERLKTEARLQCLKMAFDLRSEQGTEHADDVVTAAQKFLRFMCLYEPANDAEAAFSAPILIKSNGAKSWKN